MQATKPLALISVSDKTGVCAFARALVDLGFEILSTGGTAACLEKEGIAVTPVQNLTGFPEMLEGRVKTLHPAIHGGILYKRSQEDHRIQIREQGIRSIDLVAVNLYPFQETVKQHPDDLEWILENIDIGGPTLLRAAAKNHKDVLVLVDPGDYSEIISQLRQGSVLLSVRRELAAKVFAHTGRYDRNIEKFMAQRFLEEERDQIYLEEGTRLGRYAENWHQSGRIFKDRTYGGPSVALSNQVHGGELGYNNYLDAETALGTLLEFSSDDRACTVVIKHGNPCGLAVDQSLLRSLERAWQGDPTSAFGSVIAMNWEVDVETLKALTYRISSSGTKGWFVEVLLAPSFQPEALEWLRSKKSKSRMRLLEVGSLHNNLPAQLEIRSLRGGYLVQESDEGSALLSPLELSRDAQNIDDPYDGKSRLVGVVCGKLQDEKQVRLLDWTNRAAKHLKSNAISIGRILPEGGFQLLGAGMGQPNRKDSAQLALDRALSNLKAEYRLLSGEGSEYEKAVLQSQLESLGRIDSSSLSEEDYIRDQLAMNCAAASDAFFPFSDGVEQLAQGGIRTIIQPGGSIRDDEIIEAAGEMEVTMVFTGMRHFKH